MSSNFLIDNIIAVFLCNGNIETKNFSDHSKIDLLVKLDSEKKSEIFQKCSLVCELAIKKRILFIHVTDPMTLQSQSLKESIDFKEEMRMLI